MLVEYSEHCRKEADRKYHRRLCSAEWQQLRLRCSGRLYATAVQTREDLAGLMEQLTVSRKANGSGKRVTDSTGNKSAQTQMLLIPLVAAKLLAGALQEVETGRSCIGVANDNACTEKLLETFPVRNMAGCTISEEEYDSLQLGWDTNELYVLTCAALHLPPVGNSFKASEPSNDKSFDLMTYKRFLAVAALNCISVKAKSPLENYISSLRSLPYENKEKAMDWLFDHALQIFDEQGLIAQDESDLSKGN